MKITPWLVMATLPTGLLAVSIMRSMVLLDPERIVENVYAAYAHPAFRERTYAVLMTGPSGSADIGGKEVHPAQGVMTLTVILWPEQAKDSAANTQTGRFANPGRT